MLCIAVVCQLLTMLITWPVWNVREQPVNLPLLPRPAVSFGLLMVLSLAAIPLRPREGVLVHATLFVAAVVLDQYRLQPQFISLIVLMFACAFKTGTWFARWYLASMWLWSGLHKLLSPEWLGWGSWTFLESCGIPADGWHGYFAVAVAVVEISLGLAAIFVPRRAALFCLLLHLGILLSLSPLMRNFNISVWPWNLATAIVGAWVLRQEFSPPPAGWRQALVAAVLIIPAGYYFDLVNPHLAFVLYSGNMPHAIHTSRDSLQRLDGWGSLTVPFPDSPRLFVQLFAQTAAAGDKLFIDDPRWGLPDRYFLKETDGSVSEISRKRFLHGEDEGQPAGAEVTGAEVSGIEIADPSDIWQIERSGVKLEYDENRLEVSASLAGPEFTDDALQQLVNLPNLRRLRIEDSRITDNGLAHLTQLPWLEIIEIRRSPITDRGLEHLAACRRLSGLHLEQLAITNGGLKVLDKLQLEALHLPDTPIDDSGLTHVARLTKLTWLDLSRTHVTSAGLARLRALRACNWINLSHTQIDDAGLAHLASLTRLEIVELEGTAISDAGITPLALLTELRHLNLRGTRVTPAAAENLRARLPDCQIEL